MWLLDELQKHSQDHRPAVVERTGAYTFADIWRYSELIAQDLDACGRQTPVVIYGDKDPGIVPTMIAALKTGRAYVPVDVSFPTERLRLIADAVDACVIYNFTSKVLDLPYEVRDLAQIRELLESKPVLQEISKERWVREDQDCYILFTSGSTGAPKGVPITKGNLVNFASWFFEYIRPDLCGQNVLNQASYSFDASVEMLYVYLAAGKTLVCIDKGLNDDVGALIDWLAYNNVAIWSSTPSFVDVCSKDVRFNAQILPNLKTFVLGGEVFSKNTAAYLLEHFPQAQVFNTYGPTEATVEVSGCRVTEQMLDDARSIPIGRVMPEAKWQILDEEGRPCAEGETGELVIFSKSVSRGYWQDPEKTAKAFLQDADGRMGYRTGDLVFSDGDMLYFVGRKDFQVKLSGYRIEIEDISSNLDALEIVENNAVIPVYDQSGKVDYLAAFVMLKPQAAGQPKLKIIIEIKKGLKQRVPAYMVPRKIIVLEAFPLNVNGKIDRKKLAELL